MPEDTVGGAVLLVKLCGTAKVEKIISPIVAIPTNGKGCVVIRKNGAFDVVGEIPDKLHKKLFQELTLPVKIELGT